MAKQLINPLERHAEKAVLGVAGLILLGVIAKYLVTSPNKIDLGGEVVTPSTIDEKVAKKAETVRQALRSKQPQLPEFAPSIDEFNKKLRPMSAMGLGAELASTMSLIPETPLVDSGIDVQGDKATLATVVKMDKPLVASGRMMLEAGGHVLDWATVSALFNRQQQSEIQSKAYGLKWAGVIFAPAELQRRERRPDGSWSDDDWEDVDCNPVPSMPAPPPVPLVDDGKKVTVRADDAKAIEKFVEGLGKPLEQLSYLRPLCHREVTPNWRFPVIGSLVDVARQDDEYINPNEVNPSPNPPLLRYPGLDQAPKAKSRDADPANNDPRKQLDNAEKMLKEAGQSKNGELARTARDICVELLKLSDLRSAETERGGKCVELADQILKDIRYATPEGDGEKSAVKKTRELLPVQQIWAHDAGPDSLTNGRTYQYRIRAVLLNRLLGFPEKFENPKDATQPFISGEWSEPSDPVTIEPASQFFVSRGQEDKREVTIEVYQWHRGVWVAGKKKAKAGERLSWEERAPTPDPQNPDQVYNALVRFAPDASVVDIDFERRARARKLEKGGVKIQAPEKTTAVVFVDSEGKLHERLEIADKNDSVKNTLKGRVWKAPKDGD